MDEASKIAPPPRDARAVPPRQRSRRRVLRWLAGALVALLVLAAVALAALLWAVRSSSGSAWLLEHVPRLTVTAPQGSLVGDFAAERIAIEFPGSGVLRLDRPRWHALSAARGEGGRWLSLRIETLHADRVSWLGASESTATNEPARSPASLRLPLELEVGAASVDELRVGADAATAISALHARVHLGAEGGARHRFDDLAAQRERVHASGSATIGADAPFGVAAHVALAAPDGATLPWQATADASGPLDRLDVQATARVTADGGRPAQSLAAHAVVRPFAAWPLGALEASTEALDLEVFAGDAPTTSLTGHAIVTTSGLDQPALVSIALANARAGRWNEGRLPIVRLQGTLRARPDAPGAIEVETLSAELGANDRSGGRIVGRGHWSAERWSIAADLDAVRPAALDARAPEATLSGTLSLTGSDFAAAPEQRAVEIVAQLSGPLADRRLPRAASAVARLRLEARAALNAIDLRVAEATLASAKASAAGKLVRSGAASPWRASGKLRLADFDPLPWWPGRADALLARGTSRLSGEAEFDLTLAKTSTTSTVLDAIAATRGRASARVLPSTLIGVPVEGTAKFVNDDGRPQPAFEIIAAGNKASAQGRLAAAGGSADEWSLAIDAPALDRLALWFGPANARHSEASIAGSLAAKAHLEGRWPALQSDGELQGSGLRYTAYTVRRAEARWRIGSAAEAPLDVTLALDGVDAAGRAIEHAGVRVAGTARAHHAELRIASAALPPEWADAIAAQSPTDPRPARTAASSPSAAPAPPRAAASGPTSATSSTPSRSTLVAVVEGGLVDAGRERNSGWNGSIREFVAQGVGARARTWLRAHDLRGSVFWAGGPARAHVEPGSAEALGATLRWNRFTWQDADAPGHQARLDVQATVDPIAMAPLLRAAEPDFGWGGDLTIGARIDVRSAPSTSVDVVVERAGGDLTVTDEATTGALGLTDLHLGIAAHDGVWNFTAAVAGSAFGVGSAAVVARTTSSAAWPDAATPIDGVVELRVDRLGAWGTWLPAGWRLEGELQASARIQGRAGAPTYTGHVEGSHLRARNFLQGVDISEGTVALALQGNSAHIERFSAKGGSGTVRLEGDARFDEAPVAQLTLLADKFQMLGRVDRRIVASGRAGMRLDATTVALDGAFKVDEGLIDFSRSDAPTLGDDVEVVRRPRPSPEAEQSSAASAAAVAPAAREVALDLRVDMGERLRIRGRGLDGSLRGDLRLTTPASRLAVDGTLRIVDGTYQAYGQKLDIGRGVLTFVGAVENPRLDIEATRPNLDVRVGVLVSGTALTPRVRLFSEPDMSDIDKLSWLVAGRANEGGADTALLQSAAVALLSGEGPGPGDRFMKSLGLDDIGVRQAPAQGQSDVKETIVTVGKQISKRWYVGYEHGLNTTTGSWQLIYRIAQRLTVRAQAGQDNAIDLNWTLRWN